MIYHLGYLARDRLKDDALDDLARQLWEASQRGEIFLVQKKLGDEMYAYSYQLRPPKK